MRSHRWTAVLLVVATAFGCAKTHAPRGWLPPAEESPSDRYGAWVGVEYRRADNHIAFASGELIAVMADSLYVLPRNAGLVAVSTPSVTWAQAYQRAAADYAPSLTVDAAISFTGELSDQDPFVTSGYPAFLVIENTCIDTRSGGCSLPNAYVHSSEDASDRLANDSGSPSGVIYNFAFATDVTRTAASLIAQEAVLVPEPPVWIILLSAMMALHFRRNSVVS